MIPSVGDLCTLAECEDREEVSFVIDESYTSTKELQRIIFQRYPTRGDQVLN